MKFHLVYTNGGFHARLLNARGELIFWTRAYDYKQEVLDLCAEVKMGVGEAPIQDPEFE
jgi:uncharacterized protein YegP (UPF0339 family)